MDKSGIEIGNLDINFSVSGRESGAGSDNGRTLSKELQVILKRNIVSECVKETVAILKQRQER